MKNNEKSVNIFLGEFVKRHSKPYWFRSSHFTRLALIEYAKEVTPPAGKLDREELIKLIPNPTKIGSKSGIGFDRGWCAGWNDCVEIGIKNIDDYLKEQKGEGT